MADKKRDGNACRSSGTTESTDGFSPPLKKKCALDLLKVKKYDRNAKIINLNPPPPPGPGILGIYTGGQWWGGIPKKEVL